MSAMQTRIPRQDLRASFELKMLEEYYKIRVCVIVNIANEGSIYSSGMDTASYKLVCELYCCVYEYLNLVLENGWKINRRDHYYVNSRS